MYEQAGQVVLEIHLRPRILHRLVVMSGEMEIIVVIVVIFVMVCGSGSSSGRSSNIRYGYQWWL
jgi:hypothetical protein